MHASIARRSSKLWATAWRCSASSLPLSSTPATTSWPAMDVSKPPGGKGHEFIPTLTLDVTVPEGRAFALADNRIAELSTWDEEKRAQELRDLSLEVPDLDLTVTGFSHVTIDLAIASLEQIDWSDLDAEPEPEQVPPEIGRAVQQECRDRSRMPSSA
eukprot:TRINITY_DN18979_c0_g1_i4.p1 TRINITY_DN18979_c0_g1~~TRINITY_DN18979_c0_g1_i4.p1  ORF type:complete len:158 (-),score=23.07 TRINITY_DN18979_c0_g1_i4:11-484(-)